MRSGNVVRFGKDLYIVSEVEFTTHPDTINRLTLLDFKHSSSTTHVSRKHPFMKYVPVNEDCVEGECECLVGECEYKQIPDEEHSIDAVKFVADNVQDFIMSKVKKVFDLN